MVSKMQEKERPAAMTQRRQRPPESVDLKYVAVEYRDTREICSKYNIVLHNMFLNYFRSDVIQKYGGKSNKMLNRAISFRMSLRHAIISGDLLFSMQDFVFLGRK